VTLGAQDGAVAQPTQQTFHSAVDVVTIQASVRDGRGRVVSGLTANDFEVRDNGQLRPIVSLRSDRDSPLSLAILVDMSGSMRGLTPKIETLVEAHFAGKGTAKWEGSESVGIRRHSAAWLLSD
jgi:hypothetical protein